MLNFTSIRFKNFLSYGNYFTKIPLDKSEMVLICGGNGVGKSTFLDALTFCLFGKAFRNINIPQLPNSINVKDCMVECEFHIGLTKYVIRRGLNPKIFEIIKDGVLLNQDSKSKDYQRTLEEQILKMSYKTFCQVVILGSTNYIPFMRLTAADRRTVVESLLDIGVFSSMNTILKERVSSNKDEIRTSETGIEILTNKTDTQRKYLAALEEKSQSSLDEITDEIAKTVQIKDELAAHVVKGSNTLHILNNKREIKRKADQTIQDLKKIQTTLIKKREVIESDILALTNGIFQCPSCGQVLTEEHRQTELSGKRNKQSEIILALQDIEVRIAKAVQGIAVSWLEKAEANYEAFFTTLNDQRQKLAVAEKMIDRLSSEAAKIKKSRNSLVAEQESLEELENNCDEAKKLLDGRRDDQKMFSAAQSILKDTGIKTRIIKHYLPIMNKLINHYLSSMGFFVQFNLDENFDESIKSRHRDDFTYASFSEGEKMRIDLSLLLAWREVARLKNSTNCNLLILDEVFDSSLDAGGTDEVMKLIRGLGKRCNVFVISHKTDQLIDKFPEIMTFEKKSNFSRILK